MNPKIMNTALIPLTALLLFFANSSLAAEAKLVKVEIINAERQPVGSATVTELSNGVLILLELRENPPGIPPGTRAFHIHESGICEPPFKSAGGHLNPLGKQHGFTNKAGPHLGDLPNIHLVKGIPLKVEFYVPELRLSGGKANLLDADGSALVIHARADDYRTDPAGEAGDRIACGVIGAPAPAKGKKK